MYLPSRIGLKNYLGERNPDNVTIEKQKRKSGKLSGMILDSPVVFNGMGVDTYPDYFPASFNAAVRFTAVVVLPTPPLWLAMQMIWVAGIYLSFDYWILDSSEDGIWSAPFSLILYRFEL